MDFVVNLEYKPYVPLYRRLSDALRKAILEGRLVPGQPMPSKAPLTFANCSLRITASMRFIFNFSFSVNAATT